MTAASEVPAATSISASAWALTGGDGIAERSQLGLTGGAGLGGEGQVLDGFDGLVFACLVSRDDDDLRVVAVGVGAFS